MSKEYLTSGEFASLRNVNLNSLRYYEKLKLLLPAYIDPETKYRYFRLEQLSSLDTILFFINVGLPLSTLKNYLDQDGNLDQYRVLEDGKKAMEAKIAVMKEKLAITEFDLMNLERNRWCNEQQGVFTREIGERFFIVAPFPGEWDDPTRREKTAMSLFNKGQQAGMLPTFPAGMLLSLAGEAAAYSFFVHVLRPAPGDEQILRIPAGKFSCLQITLNAKMDLPGLIRQHFGDTGSKTVILNNILKDTHQFSSRYMEIQIAMD